MAETGICRTDPHEGAAAGLIGPGGGAGGRGGRGGGGLGEGGLVIAVCPVVVGSDGNVPSE
jgi:hypothetical protein